MHATIVATLVSAVAVVGFLCTWGAGLSAAVTRAFVRGMGAAAVGLIGPIFEEPTGFASAIGLARPTVGLRPKKR